MKRTSYDQFCGLACALDLIGDRWALLVVRELGCGAKRFTDLLDGLPGIGTNTLTTRLAELEASGVIARRLIPPPLAVTVIELTDRGRALEPVLVALARWGSTPLMERQPRHPLRPAWLGLALRTYFDATAARGARIRVAIRLPLGTLSLEFGKGGLHIAEGESALPAELCITTREAVLLDVLRGAISVASAKRTHGFKMSGQIELLPRLLAAFPLGARAILADL